MADSVSGVVCASPMTRPDPVLVFGANGYTAGLILEAATAAGLRPVLAARNPERLAAVAAKYGLEQRAVGLDDPIALRRALTGVRLVLNAAGPFAQTALPMLQAPAGAVGLPQAMRSPFHDREGYWAGGRRS